MKSFKLKTYTIVGLVSVLGLIFALPGFAETQDELKKIFLTREEFEKWAHGDADVTGFSEYLETLEIKKQEEIQSIVHIEMSKRELNTPTEESTEASSS